MSHTTVAPKSVVAAESSDIDGVPDIKYCPPGEPYPPKKFDRPLGWKGGFAESKPEFAYPKPSPDLSSIKVTTNMSNIGKITRQMRAKWPQFSWQKIPGDNTSRCYVKFAEYISRYGYDDTGKIWALICPQQGAKVGKMGEMNVEITVTGIRGYVDEPNRSVAAELGVMGQIWFTGDNNDNPFFIAVANYMDKHLEFPFTKSKSVRVLTNEINNPRQPLFRNLDGMSKDYKHPAFSQHWDEAYTVSTLAVEIGEVASNPGESEITKDFNQLIVDVFNLGAGNMLMNKNVLSWDIWLSGPETVKPAEWREHAQKWRESMDVNHRDPIGIADSSQTFKYDGSPVPSPWLDPAIIDYEANLFQQFFKKHFDHEEAAKRVKDPKDLFTQADHDILADAGFIKKVL